MATQMQPNPALSSRLPTALSATLSGDPAGNFSERIRNGLRPLLADDALLERTALKIEQSMRSLKGFPCQFSEQSGFFDFEGKVGRVIAHFARDGLTHAAYLRGALKRVTLFFQNPETLIHNIEGVTDHFSADGLTRPAYLRGAVIQPQLFYQKPMTLIGNIERVVDHFKDDGLTCGKYVRAAARQPSLFFRKPDTMIRHVDLITDLYRKGLLNLLQTPDMPNTDAAPVLEFMLTYPMLFTMSEDNIALREIYARATNVRPSRKLMLRRRHDVVNRLSEALGLTPQNREAAISALLHKIMAEVGRDPT